MTDTKDPKDQNDEKREENQQDEDKERDDILGQLSEKEGQEAPEKKVPAEESKKEQAPQERPTSESDETEDIESLIDKKITDQPQTDNPESEAMAEEPVEELSAMQKIVGVFTQPQRVFQYLRSKPEFLLPLIITMIVGVVVSYMVYDIAINESITNFEQNEDIPNEQRDMIIDSIESRRTGAWRYASIFLFPILGTIVIFALVTLAYWFIGNVVLGGKAKFKEVFSVFAYSYLILTIAGTIVKLPLMLSKETLKVHTSLAIFMSEDAAQSALYRFLDSFDIFTIWLLFVFAIGYAVIYRFSQVKAFMGVFISWLLYVLVFNVALGSFFSRFSGQ